jgi:hypothetical protein
VHVSSGLRPLRTPPTPLDVPVPSRYSYQEACWLLLARAISLRTKVALAAAKARGVKLGGWRGGAPRDTTAATAGVARKADTFAADVGPMATDMRRRGLSLRQVAAEMTRRGIKTPRGGAWTATAVRNVLARVPA